MHWVVLEYIIWMAIPLAERVSVCVCVHSHSDSGQPHGCSLPVSSVHGIFQAGILEWVVMSSSRESSWPRDWTRVCCLRRQIPYPCTSWEEERVIWHQFLWEEWTRRSFEIKRSFVSFMPGTSEPRTFGKAGHLSPTMASDQDQLLWICSPHKLGGVTTKSQKMRHLGGTWKWSGPSLSYDEIWRECQSWFPIMEQEYI